MMIFIRSLLFNALFYLWSAFIYTIFMPILLTNRKFFIVAKIWAFPILYAIKTICNIEIEIRGEENIPNQSCIVASKHQSALETILQLTMLNVPVFVIKKSLARIPIYGMYVRKARFISIDRAAGSKALKDIITQAKARIAEGRHIVIYPEGTRTAPGAEPDYQPGVAALYRQNIAPIVPVALNTGLFWPKGGFIKKPGKVVVEILPPMEGGIDKKDFMKELERRIETKTNELIEESRAQIELKNK